MSREDELNARIREIPLTNRLDQSNSMIAKMCSQHRGPKMTIPVQWDDEDYFICRTVKDAKQEIDALKARVAELEEALKSQAMVHYTGTTNYCFCDKWQGRDGFHSKECERANAALAKKEPA